MAGIKLILSLRGALVATKQSSTDEEIASGYRPRNDIWKLIGFRKIDFAFGRLAADDASSFGIWLIERNVAGRGFGLFLDFGFTLA